MNEIEFFRDFCILNAFFSVIFLLVCSDIFISKETNTVESENTALLVTDLQCQFFHLFHKRI